MATGLHLYLLSQKQGDIILQMVSTCSGLDSVVALPTYLTTYRPTYLPTYLQGSNSEQIYELKVNNLPMGVLTVILALTR